MQPKKKPTLAPEREPPDPSRQADSQRIGELEEQLNEIIEISSDFYFEMDEQHRFTVLRGPTIDKWKFDTRPLFGKTRWELPHTYPVSDGGTWEHYKRRLDAHEPIVDFTYKYVNANSEMKYTATSGRPRYDAQGRFIGYRGLGRDVTERVRMEQRLAIEREVARILAEAPTWTEVTRRIVEQICAILACACGAHWVVDEEQQVLRCIDTWGSEAAGVSEFLAASKIPPIEHSEGGLVRRTFVRGEPEWIKNVAKDPTFRRAASAAAAGLRSALAFPIKAGGKTIGVMEFYWRETPHHADEELLRSVARLGESVGQFYDRKQGEEELRQFRAVMDASPDLIFVVDPEKNRFIYVNEANTRASGYTREEYKRLTPAQASGADPAAIKELYDQVIALQGEVHMSEIMYRNDARAGWFETTRRAVRVGDKWIVASISREITERKLTEKKAAWLGSMYAALSATNEAIMHARSAQELYQQVCDAAALGGKFLTAAVYLPESDGATMRVASAAGVGEQQMREARISTDETVPEGRGLVGTAFRTGQPSVSNDFLADERMQPWHEISKRGGAKSGAAVPLMRGGRKAGALLICSGAKRAFNEEAVKLLQRMADNIGFALDNFDREAERKRAEERIQYLATHDGLTGLPNRVMFSQLLNPTIESARRYRRKFAVLFIDLDRFKVINDTLGHEAGDQLLKEIANRLRETLRTSDTVARLGGDEFVVLVQEVADAEQAASVARKVLSTVTRPIALAGQECRVTASIGIAMFPNDGDDEQTLMKNADIAMYHAKEEGKNNFQFHSAKGRSQSLEQLALETNLRDALERNEFSLNYQAQLDLKTGRITGVEALLRWNNAALGSVSPAQFIPIAEVTGLIVPIGKWVLRTACKQNVEWQRQGLPPICMAVNLSARQFSDEHLLADIAAALKDSGMRPELLELEITEGMVIHNPERAVAILTAIKNMGVRLAIDDFGTGYSSLGQLKNFPIDTLKVDRSFIREIPTDAEDKAITEAIIAMGKTLRLTVIAEGVETEAQMNFLREHGCDEMQGYYFSKPVVPDDFAALLRRHTPRVDRQAS